MRSCDMRACMRAYSYSRRQSIAHERITPTPDSDPNSMLVVARQRIRMHVGSCVCVPVRVMCAPKHNKT